MKKLNHKGFTLVEILAVIVIIALLGIIAVPNVLSSIDASKTVAENTMKENIKTAAQELFDEVDLAGVSLRNYKADGTDVGDAYVFTSSSSTTITKTITIFLQTLIVNGFLNGSGEGDNKVLINPKTGKNIGNCRIKIIKTISKSDYSTSYTITGLNDLCPSF